jgi:hypothetical protein
MTHQRNDTGCALGPALDDESTPEGVRTKSQRVTILHHQPLKILPVSLPYGLLHGQPPTVKGFWWVRCTGA